jgi:hypothetical protein
MPTLARDKYETIDATAYGTSTQPGRNIGVTVIIYEWVLFDRSKEAKAPCPGLLLAKLIGTC